MTNTVALTPIDWFHDECPCGASPVQVLTSLENARQNTVEDGDPAECYICGQAGNICCDVESEAFVMWDDE